MVLLAKRYGEKTLKGTQVKFKRLVAVPTFLYALEIFVVRKHDLNRIHASEM